MLPVWHDMEVRGETLEDLEIIRTRCEDNTFLDGLSDCQRHKFWSELATIIACASRRIPFSPSTPPVKESSDE